MVKGHLTGYGLHGSVVTFLFLTSLSNIVVFCKKKKIKKNLRLYNNR